MKVKTNKTSYVMLASNFKRSLRLRLIDVLRGTSILKILSDLRKDQFLPRQEIDAIRKSRFDNLFNTARTSTKYYAKYQSYEELPVLTKDMVRENFPDLISSSYKKKLYTKGTGGSTGNPLVYYTTIEAQSYLWAGLILSWETAGYKLGDRVAFVAGTSLFKSSWKHRVFHNLLNVHVYSAFSLNDENISIYIDEIIKRKTSIIYGYANAIGIIANYINTTKPVVFPHLKGIVSSAEVLTDANRQNIEKAFGVKVFNQYGCNEAGISAFECEHHKLHLISSRAKYETDGDGNLISTDLANEGFILMKYFTGDIVEFSDKACTCKRSFPVIEKVVGRSNDVVTDTKNKVLHSEFFGHLFRKDETIKQFQISFDQEAIILNLSVDEQREDEDYGHYIEAVKKHLKFKDYRLMLNEPFLKAENAKHKFVIDNRQ